MRKTSQTIDILFIFAISFCKCCMITKEIRHFKAHFKIYHHKNYIR